MIYNVNDRINCYQLWMFMKLRIFNQFKLKKKNNAFI